MRWAAINFTDMGHVHPMSRLEKEVQIPSSEGRPEPELRLLTALDDFKASVVIQRKIWGGDYADIVPASLLQATRKVNAIIGGAFLPESDELVGFVFGFTGIRNGRATHWSHMLGVLPEQRGRGIGESLKLAQRQWVLDQGADEMRWTFDPLFSGNAHFNLNLLGIDVESYEPDMYGDTGSALHSFGTDRFIAHWNLNDPVRRRSGKPPGTHNEPPVVNTTDEGEPRSVVAASADAPSSVRIAIPRDIVAINRADPPAALRWRVSTRSAFMEYLKGGYRTAGFYRDREAGRSFYVLERR